jgi:membrane fusion protein (multidrug efflux system)
MVTTLQPRAALALGVVLAAAACGSAPAARETEAVTGGRPVLATVETVTVALPITVESQVYVEHDAIVYARSAGLVNSVQVDLGARVRAGQVLATLEDVDQRIALDAAEQTHTIAQRNVVRARTLGGQGMVTTADSEQAEFAFQQAELDVRRARRAEELTRVIAPFAGNVTARRVRAGRLVSPGDSLYRVTALAPLLVSVRVPETAGGTLAVGDSAEVRRRDGSRARATVVRVSPAIDAGSGTRECILRVADDAGFPPGANVTVHLGAERRTVVAVPADAVSEDGYVAVVEAGRTTLRAVTTGAALGDGRLEVVSGLSPGERVVRTAR